MNTNEQSKLSYDPAKLAISQCLISSYQNLQKDFGITDNNLENKFDLEIFFKSLETPPEKNLGDFALPVFRFAKALKKNPVEVAQAFKRDLDKSQNEWILSTELKGPFLNIFINAKTLAKNLIPRAINDSIFSELSLLNKNSEQKIMVEYSQPNTHKEFHVGHGRNVCLGDTLCRILRYTGSEVIAANYIGDEGAHIAKCLWGLENYTGLEKIEEVENKAEWLGERYVWANKKLKETTDPETLTKYQAEISKILHSIEKKEGKYYEVWNRTRQYCLDDFDRIYKWLDVHFNHFFYESEVSEAAQDIVDEYIKKGLFVEDQGAIGLDMQEKKLGFFMARKSDGSTLYITKDLALARLKFEQFKIDRSIYVVGDEQNFHFKQLFYALELMGFKQAAQCYHLSYGMVVRPEGKMSSRAGNSFTFLQLIDLVNTEIKTYLEKYQGEWTEKEIADVAHKLSVGAIKYGMLHIDPQKEIVFDPKEWVSFEGNSGPYLMYSYARTQSIIRKASEQGMNASTAHLELLSHESEKDLMRHLYDFNHIVKSAGEHYRPSLISTHLFFTCKSLNRFYTDVSVMKAESKELSEARLALLASFAKTLKMGLYLLGITPAEKM